MGQHTPGPWWHSADSNGNITIRSKQGLIGTVASNSWSNANLVAAAPVLLAALVRMLDEQPFQCDTETCECGDGNGRDERGNVCEHIQARRAITEAVVA